MVRNACSRVLNNKNTVQDSVLENTVWDGALELVLPFWGGGIRPVLADDGGVAVRKWRPLRLKQHKNNGVLLDPPPLPSAGEDQSDLLECGRD